MSQTNTPSGAAEVDVLAVLNRTAAFAARGRLRAHEYSARQCVKENREDQAAIDAVAALLARNAELEAEQDALRAAAEKAHAFLTHNYWGNWTYMEGSEFYEELREHAKLAKLLSDALARTPAKENGDA